MPKIPKISNDKIPRWVLYLVLFGVALDLAVSAVLAVNVVDISAVGSSAHQSKVGLYQACIQTNNYRRVDLQRWDAVLKLINTMPKNQQLQEFVNGVDKANRSADKPQVCVAP